VKRLNIKRSRKKIRSILEELYESGLTEYLSSGHRYDVYAITPDNIKISVGIAWTPRKINLSYEMLRLHRSPADVKILIVHPKILKNLEFVREFGKTKMREIGRDVVVSELIDGSLILDRPQKTFKGIIMDLVSEARGKRRVGEKRSRLASWIRAHHNQLVEEVYEKWFYRSSESSFVSAVRFTYAISLAKITYSDGTINTTELKEPSHQNKKIVEEALEHLKCYPHVLDLWEDAKVKTVQTLEHVRNLWKYLEARLIKRLSVDCPQLVEWHGRGPKPNNYYNKRITLSYLWNSVQRGSPPTDLSVSSKAGYFTIINLAESLDEETMNRFLKVMEELATDSTVQERMKTIFAQKISIEKKLHGFQDALKDIADDVKRKHKRLKCSCPTCEPWLKK